MAKNDAVDKPFMVKALKEGYYGKPNRRIHEDQRFMCLKEEDFSSKWMERCDGKPASTDSDEEVEVVLLADMDGAVRDTKIVDALGRLDKDNDDHWTTGGKPAMEALREMLDASVTRAHVDAACPGFAR